jgi:hypothetical protein
LGHVFPYTWRGVVVMGRLAFAALVLSLEILGQISTSETNAGLNGKTNVANGVARPSQMSSGMNASICPNEGSTWGSCGGGAPAGITYATTALNWTQTIPSALTSGSQATVTLTPCPVGIDTTSEAGYQVLLSGGGNSEAVSVSTAAGACTSGAASGTITFTPFYSYTAGYTIGSASSGIQETINAACGTSSTYYKNSQCNITIPANGPNSTVNTYNVFGTIFLHSSNSILNGYGVLLNCLGRGTCLQVGDLANSNDYSDNTVTGLGFVSTNYSSLPAYAGVNLTNTAKSSGIVTITTATPHGFRPGDMVTIMFTDNNAYWGDAVVATVPTATTFSYAHTGADIATQATPGVVALAYSAILDDAGTTHFIDLTNNGGWFNNFFDMWDDENATIDHFKTGGADLNHSANWSGSFVFSAGNQGGRQMAPVITLRDSTITSSANGVTVYNSNGLYIENTVIQGTSLWQVHSSNETGNYQGAYLKNIYSESTIGANPLTPAHSPFPGLGIAGLIAGGGVSVQIAGNGGVLGGFQTGGTGSTPYSYFIVANDTTTGTQTSPMQVLNWESTGSDSIPVRWPRVANGADAITYDVIRMTTPAGVGAVYPYSGGCPGGPGGTCGYVAQGLSQSAACSGGLVCTYTDNGSLSTSTYTIKQGTYGGTLVFWPGSIVSVRNSITVDQEQGPAVGVGLKGNPIQISNSCSGNGQASPGGYTTCLASISNEVAQTATLLSDGPPFSEGAPTISKGRLNFATTPYVGSIFPHHVITLLDSQPGLTEATFGYRPLASANDTWIGLDMPSSGAGLNSGQLAFGAPVSITNYIAQVGDGAHANWLERLTSKQKTFAVPVKISEGNSFTLGDGSPLSQMKIYRSNKIPVSHVPPQSCIDVIGEAKGITKLDQITSITPPGKLGNLSLNAYPGDEDAIILHFCNPSRFEAITPDGTYSFLSVR